LADKILEGRPDEPVAQRIAQTRKSASSRLQSAAAAISQMLLVLHAMGLGAVWMSGPVQAKEEIEKILSVPEGLDFVALIPVGYPAQEPKVPRHKTLEELVTVFR